MAAEDFAPRGDILVRGGYLLTMDQAGDIPDGDVHVSGGEIHAVGRGLDAPGAEVIDAGITTVHDWAHNIRGREWAEAGLRALTESGLRARFSYGYATGHPNDQAMALDDLAHVHGTWPAYSAGGRIHLGMAWRGTGGSDPAMRVDPKIYRAEIEAARGLGLPVSVSPFTELQIGYGQPVTGQLLAAGLSVGLSVDTTMLSGNADMFGIMKVAQACENGNACHEFALSARDVLRLATIEGARTLGLDSVTGSLAPGKRADLIAVSVDAWNLGVLTDPVRLLATAAHPGNVRTVIADGRILKRGGILTGYDAADVTRSARSALAGVLARA